MQKVKLAEALLRRKELAEKVNQLRDIQQKALFEIRVNRIKAQDGIDEVVANVPKLTASQVTEEYDFYARQLRLCDAAIQRTNWEADIELNETVMQDYRKV